MTVERKDITTHGSSDKSWLLQFQWLRWWSQSWSMKHEVQRLQCSGGNVQVPPLGAWEVWHCLIQPCGHERFSGEGLKISLGAFQALWWFMTPSKTRACLLGQCSWAGYAPPWEGWKLRPPVNIFLRVRWNFTLEPLACVREFIAMIKSTIPPHRVCFLSAPPLSLQNQLFAKQRWWVLTPSAPGQCFCRPEVSAPHTQKLSPALAGVLSKAPAALANGPSFESLTLSISVSQMNECLRSNS